MDRRHFIGSSAAAFAAAGLQTIAVTDARAAPSALAGARFDHVSLNVRDFDALLAWYRDRLGFSVEVAWRVAALGGKRLAYLTVGSVRFELVEADPDGVGLPPAESFPDHFARTGFGHLCLVVDDVDAALVGLERDGVETFVEAATYPLDGTPFERRVGFIQDPEGNVIEFAGALRRRS
ncbi:MAG: VOC family protein [Pseudomonadota bacterium]